MLECVRWTENEILKHLYASKFVYEKTIKDLNIWEVWRGDKMSRTITPGVRALYVILNEAII